jgi:N6-adenosine-specific RNA methylase IME4
MKERAPDFQLVQIDAARKALAEAHSVADVKDLRDKAAAMQRYLQQRDGSKEAAFFAGELKLRAERKLGSLLEGTVKAGGDAKFRTLHAERIDLPPDISYTQSHRWQTVAALPEEDFDAYLADVKKHDDAPTTQAVYTLARKREQQKRNATARTAKDVCTVQDLTQLIRARRTFSTIYADPPWQYGNQATRAATDNHYDTMTVADIAALPIAQLAAPAAHVHLWTTNAFLFDAKHILEAWGFAYKSVLVWVKPHMGIGNYWRVAHEFLVLGVRGHLPFLDHARKSWVEADREQHSTKPQIFRSLIERVSPAPRLELFGRRSAPGWTVWGNAITRTVFERGGEHVA